MRQPSHLRKRRKRGNPDGAGSARADQDPHKIPTTRPRQARAAPGRAAAGRAARRGLPRERGRRASRPAPARPVIELEFGIRCTRPEDRRGPLAGGLFTRTGERQYRQGATEAKLAAKLEKVTERLQADAPNMERPGADLIAHYLDPDRLPVEDRWSRKHAHTQRRLCERFAAPVIGAVTCQDIKTGHTQQIVNAAPTRRGRRPGARDALRAGRGGHRGRVPGQPAAGQGALAGRGPPAARPAGEHVPGNRRCGSTPPRSRPATTSASSARRWPRAGTASGTS